MDITNKEKDILSVTDRSGNQGYNHCIAKYKISPKYKYMI